MLFIQNKRFKVNILFLLAFLIQGVLGLDAVKTLDSTSGYQADSPLNHFRGNDNFHTGRSIYAGTSYNVTRCSIRLDNIIVGAPAIDSSGNIYIGTGAGNSNYFYSISSTCSTKWSSKTGQIFAATPAIGANGNVYIGDLNRNFTAFDSSTGSLLWRYPTNGEIHASPVIGADGTIYIGDYSNTFYAFNSDGTIKWTLGTANPTFRAMAAISSDNVIYVCSYTSNSDSDSRMFALNAATGTQYWNRTITNQVQSSPAIGSDGTIYVGSYDKYLYALDPTAGSTKWKFGTGGSIKSSPAIAAEDGTIYFGSDDYNVYALYSNGSQRWSYPTFGLVQSSPVIDKDGNIFIGSNDDNLYSLYPSGSLRWKYKTGGDVTSSAAIAIDGTVFIGSNDKSLYAINIPLPTSTPTQAPTRKPTRTPTASPTSYLYGTLQTVQTFEGASASDFLATAGESVFKSAVIDILSSLLTLDSSAIDVISSTDTTASSLLHTSTRLLRSTTDVDSRDVTKRSRPTLGADIVSPVLTVLKLLFLSPQATTSALVTYNILFSYLYGASNEPDTTSKSIYDLLEAAIASGSFTSKLQSYAAASTVSTGLSSVSAGEIANYGVIGTPTVAPTLSVTNAAPPTESTGGGSSSSSSSSLGTGAIIGIIIGVVVLALLAVAYLFFSKPNNKQYGNDRSADISALDSNYMMSVVSNDKGIGDEPYAVNSYYDYEGAAEVAVGQSHNSNISCSSGTNTASTKKQAIVLYQPLSDSSVEMKANKSARVYPIKWTDLKVSTEDPRDAIIGKGSFGVVFRAVLSTSDNAEVVVKVMKQTGRAKDDKTTFRTAFEECRIIKEAESKMIYKDCIVKVYGIADGPLPKNIADAMNVHTAIGIVLRYEGGGTLTDRIHPRIRSGKEIESNLQSQLDGSQSSVVSASSSNVVTEPGQIDMKEKMRLITGLARGLVELHSAGIVHGDIKPDNILLSSDDPPEVRLADFGLARIREEDDMGMSSLNETAHTKGTLLYCAPEMMVNPYEDVSTVTSLVAKASRKSDMYAFALVSWEILTGLKPYDDVKRETTLAMKVHQGERPPISKIPADCPKKVIDMIQLCWDRDRFMRESAVKCFSKLQYEYRQLTNVYADVCLSYHESNRTVCEYYYHRLTQLGCKVSILEKDTPAQENHAAIASSQIMVAFLNIAYQDDEVCMTELRKARQQSIPPKPVFPIFTETGYVKWTDQDIDYLCQIRSEKQKRWDVSNLSPSATIKPSTNVGEEERKSVSVATVQLRAQENFNEDFGVNSELLRTRNINIIDDESKTTDHLDAGATTVTTDKEEDIYNHTDYNSYIDDLYTVVEETLRVHKEKYLEKLIESTTHQHQSQPQITHIGSSKGSALNSGYSGLNASASTQKQPSNKNPFRFSHKKGAVESLFNFSSARSSASFISAAYSPRSPDGGDADNEDISRSSFRIMGSNDGLIRGSNHAHVSRFSNENNGVVGDSGRSHDTNSFGNGNSERNNSLSYKPV